MELEDQRSNADTRTITILCCVCGIKFNPSQTKTNMCVNCIAHSSDVTLGITKQGLVNVCRSCRRYQKPPWLYCERESKELLSLLLKKIKGLNKVKLVDTVFIWTEPHSKRIKLKLTIQKEVQNNASLQQSFFVEFVENFMQCDDCKKEYTPHTWGATVQLRQKANHKRTFLQIEQYILKHNAHAKVLKVEDKDDGLNFYYKSKQDAQKLVDFLQGLVPTRIKTSQQLVSENIQNATASVKYAWSIEIPSICKDDLVFIPKKLSKELGGVSQVLICTKVSNQIHMIDPVKLKRLDLSSTQYFLYENDFQIFPLKVHGVEFLVMDSEKIVNENLNQSFISSFSNKYLDRITEIQISRVSDWKSYTLRTHLGNLAKCGASLSGFDLTQMNVEDMEQLKDLPDIIVVKRIYPDSKKNSRIFKLKRLEEEGVIVEEKQKKKKNNQNKEDQDFEDFMEEIDQNKDIREKMNLYRDEENIKKLNEKEFRRRQQKRKEGARDRKVVKVTAIKKPEAKKTEGVEKGKEEEEKKTSSTSNNNKDKEKNNDKKQTNNKANDKQQNQQYKKSQINQKKENQDDNSDDFVTDSEEENYNETKLEELLSSLQIEDVQEKTEEDDEKAVEAFINALEKVKIEKK